MKQPWVYMCSPSRSPLPPPSPPAPSRWPHGMQHARLPCFHCLLELAQTHVHWVNDTFQLSRPLSSPSPALVLPSIRVFSSELALCIRWPKIGASASASVLPVNMQGWFLGLTGFISFLSKRLSRVLSSTTIQKHQFFSAQPSLWSNSHICTWLLENHSFDCMDVCQQNDVSAF